MNDKKEKQVDESWKAAAEQEKIILGSGHTGPQTGGKIVTDDFAKHEDEEADDHDHDHGGQCGCGHSHGDCHDKEEQAFELNFLNYITSLGFQAMIFLGEIPHPATNEMETNLEQAKLLIDTLVMLRDKTKGNLSQQEENMLNASIYELQMKFVETAGKDHSAG